MKHLTKPIQTLRCTMLPLLMIITSHSAAASNEETLQYIIADYQAQCEKAQEDFRDIDYEEGDPVVAELKLSKDNIYEITIDKGGKTATVLHAAFTCTNVGRSWCGSGGCDSYVIVDGVSYTAWGWKPGSFQVGERYVVVVPRSGGACNNSSEASLWGGSPCYTVSVWDDEVGGFNSPSSREPVLKISDFEP